MNPTLKGFLRNLNRYFGALGIDLRAILSLRNLPLYMRHRALWKRQGGAITRSRMMLRDYSRRAGTANGHYFHQDLLVAGFVSKRNPKRHIDVASRVDGFVAHVASFREIEVVDIRPLEKSEHENIKFVQADVMNPQELGETDSLSCLHALEHFGLGRYADPIDVSGHIKGAGQLAGMLASGGTMYISVPIGMNDEVHFNAHRVFHPQSILAIPSIAEQMKMTRFDYVDDSGRLHLDVAVEDAIGRTKYGCGIYTFQKM